MILGQEYVCGARKLNSEIESFTRSLKRLGICTRYQSINESQLGLKSAPRVKKKEEIQKFMENWWKLMENDGKMIDEQKYNNPKL